MCLHACTHWAPQGCTVDVRKRLQWKWQPCIWGRTFESPTPKALDLKRLHLADKILNYRTSAIPENSPCGNSENHLAKECQLIWQSWIELDLLSPEFYMKRSLWDSTGILHEKNVVPFLYLSFIKSNGKHWMPHPELSLWCKRSEVLGRRECGLWPLHVIFNLKNWTRAYPVGTTPNSVFWDCKIIPHNPTWDYSWQCSQNHMPCWGLN